VLVTRGFDIWLHSYFLAGLVQLAQNRQLKLRIGRAREPICPAAVQPSVMLLLRCWPGGQQSPRLVCFDPLDHSNGWQHPALAACDLYFKRSYYQPDVQALPANLRAKVRPLNPIFATWVPRAHGWAVQLFMRQLALLLGPGSAQPVQQRLRAALQSLRHFTSLSSLDWYEDQPASLKRHQVLFQTRLWDPAQETEDWVAPCNQHRVGMVRQLRQRLGDRLVGGLVRTPYTEREYPDLLSNLTETATAKRPEFIRLCRQFLVRVNIRALFDAVPYSLGETLAANNCLVSESIRNAFATPLMANRDFLNFDSSEQCADLCKGLLENPGQAHRLRLHQQQYYEQAVRPKEAMRLYLSQVFNNQVSTTTPNASATGSC
jgi:hypothetical protein